MQHAAVCEDQQAIRVLTGNHKAVFTVHRLLIPLIGRRIQQLHIAELVLHIEDIHLLHRRLIINCLAAILDQGTPGHRKFLLDDVQLLGKQGIGLLPGTENALVLPDPLQGLLMLLCQLQKLETDELGKPHIQNGLGLPLGEAELPDHRNELLIPLLEFEFSQFSRHQGLLRIRLRLTVPEQGNDGVDEIHGLDQALLDLLLGKLLVQKVLVLGINELVLELHILPQNGRQRQRLRPAVHDGQHVDAEGILQLGLLVEDIGDPLDIRAVLQLQHDPHAVLVGLVRDVHDLRQLLRLHQLRHILHELHDALADHGVGNFRHHQLVPVGAPLLPLEFQPSPELEPSDAGPVNAFEIRLIRDNAACGEVRAREVRKHFRRIHLRLFEIGLDQVNELSQVVAGCGGGHTHRDTLRAVQKEIGNPGRQHHRLLQLLIVVQLIGHCGVQIPQHHLIGEALQPGLGISGCGGGIALNGAEVSLSVHQRLHSLEILGQHHQRVVNGGVAVGMILTHGITADTGRLQCGPIMIHMELIHIIKHSPLHRLQAVPDIRHRTGGDYTHGIIQIGFLHFLRVFRC